LDFGVIRYSTMPQSDYVWFFAIQDKLHLPECYGVWMPTKSSLDWAIRKGYVYHQGLRVDVPKNWLIV